MLKIYKTIGGSLTRLDSLEEKNLWIDVTDPDEAELQMLCSRYDLDIDLLKASLDEEERPRIEAYDDQVLILISMPNSSANKSPIIYNTIPLGIVITEQVIITVALKESMKAHYGKFSGVKNYIALVGRKSPGLEEKAGYCGEQIVLKAQELGLNTCVFSGDLEIIVSFKMRRLHYYCQIQDAVIQTFKDLLRAAAGNVKAQQRIVTAKIADSVSQMFDQVRLGAADADVASSDYVHFPEFRCGFIYHIEDIFRAFSQHHG